MLSKEEIEKRVLYTKSKFWGIKHREAKEGIEILLEVIEQLEEDKQKLIEKLEEDNKKDNKSVKYYEQAKRECLINSPYKRIYQNTINCSNAQIETRKEIIKILKGEEEDESTKTH